MYSFFLLFFLFSFGLSDSKLDWIEPSSPSLSGGFAHSAAGYDSIRNIIHFIGGNGGYSKYVVKYDVDANTFDIKANELTADVSVTGQGYTQLGNKLYSVVNSKFLEYDVITGTIVYPLKDNNNADVVNPNGGGTYSCLTGYIDNNNNNNKYLISGIATNIKIYDFTNGGWVSNVPGLTYSADNMACVTYNNYVYMIGGHPNRYNIEKLDVSDMSNIATKSWETTSTKLPLTYNPYSGRVVVYNNKIYIMHLGNTNDVFILDPTNNDSLKKAKDLPSGITQSGAVVADNGRIYLFSNNKWIYSSSLKPCDASLCNVVDKLTELINQQTPPFQPYQAYKPYNDYYYKNYSFEIITALLISNILLIIGATFMCYKQSAKYGKYQAVVKYIDESEN